MNCCPGTGNPSRISPQLPEWRSLSGGYLEAALDDEDEQTAEPQAGRPVSRQQGLLRYERALKSLAKARWARRRVSEKSQDGMLLAWLSPKRIPEDDVISELGKLLAEQSRLRKFERLERLFLRGLPDRSHLCQDIVAISVLPNHLSGGAANAAMIRQFLAKWFP